MKKKKINQFDLLIEDMANKFSQIKGFEKLQETEKGKQLFSLIIKSTTEIHDLEMLFLNYYIPASSKAMADGWKMIVDSKYRKLLNLGKEDLKENTYETIRLGYVGMFHKYEAQLKYSVDIANYILEDCMDEFSLLTIEKYCKKEFEVDIFKSHHLFPVVSRINYICNCIKHYNGYPIKIPVHPDFINADKEKKLKIEKEEFKTDIQRLKKQSELIFSQIILMAVKQLVDKQFQDPEFITPELEEKYKIIQRNNRFVLSDFYAVKV